MKNLKVVPKKVSPLKEAARELIEGAREKLEDEKKIKKNEKTGQLSEVREPDNENSGGIDNGDDNNGGDKGKYEENFQEKVQEYKEEIRLLKQRLSNIKRKNEELKFEAQDKEKRLCADFQTILNKIQFPIAGSLKELAIYSESLENMDSLESRKLIAITGDFSLWKQKINRMKPLTMFLRVKIGEILSIMKEADILIHNTREKNL